ncbi:acyl-CoA dehydrogenase [Candidatus Microthrix sp.]|uniref:acyl-CoA dehydrogenase n=1 Tax=Candidatus Neomicrothrix sp. TaxID=2719034 RepID=UPI002599C084|nr:acyl-CoA dehydrogenase [Candidatus Microthrix sp.]HMS46291.1 acyl-CoA dehydrogenase [Candidatus Microthrix sp.]
MQDYTPPLDDIRFLLDRVLDLPALLETEKFSELDSETVHDAIEAAGTFIAEVIAPTNAIGDQVGTQLQPDGTMVTPEGFKEAYAKLVEAGWGALTFDPAYGGGGFPEAVGIALQEFMVSSNMAFSMAPLLTQGSIHAINSVADEYVTETYLAKLVSGEWTGTMNLSEPEAGSDVGALRTKAEPNGDGTWSITGNKIYISWGDHDMADNVVHLVLARTPDAPPGTKGISCFIVPKFMVNDDGTLGEPNDLKVVSIEHKMGINASPTCTMSFGDQGGATGWLLGNEFDGMRVMFVMMNMARLSVGVQGLGLAERTLQGALAHANERVQGKVVGTPKEDRTSPIVGHPDVRRMLLDMRSITEAMRGICLMNAVAMDGASALSDEDDRQKAEDLNELLIPITKAWCTDMGVEVTSLAVQVFGGMGFVEETGVSQFFRDARIAPIYEGTNGIQAMDLVGRKLPMRAGGVVTDTMANIRTTIDELNGQEELAGIASRLSEATDALDEATQWIFANSGDIRDVLSGATPYLRMWGLVVGGWVLGKSALAATEWAAEGGDEAFCTEKVRTARWFADQQLPAVAGLVPRATAGAALMDEASL